LAVGKGMTLEKLVQVDKFILASIPVLLLLCVVVYLLILIFQNQLLDLFSKKVYKMCLKFVYKARKSEIEKEWQLKEKKRKKDSNEDLLTLKKLYKKRNITPLVIISSSGEIIKQIPSISQLDQILVTNHFYPIEFPTSDELEKHEAYKCNRFIGLYPSDFIPCQNILKIVGQEEGFHRISGGDLMEDNKETKIINHGSDKFVFGVYKFSFTKSFLSIVSMAKKLLKTNKEIN
jgi:hypothetical protein